MPRRPCEYDSLGRLTGDAEVAAANTRQLHTLIELGARDMAHAQHAGGLSADRDPEFLADTAPMSDGSGGLAPLSSAVVRSYGHTRSPITRQTTPMLRSCVGTI